MVALFLGLFLPVLIVLIHKAITEKDEIVIVLSFLFTGAYILSILKHFFNVW